MAPQVETALLVMPVPRSREGIPGPPALVMRPWRQQRVAREPGSLPLRGRQGRGAPHPGLQPSHVIIFKVNQQMEDNCYFSSKQDEKQVI